MNLVSSSIISSSVDKACLHFSFCSIGATVASKVSPRLSWSKYACDLSTRKSIMLMHRNEKVSPSLELGRESHLLSSKLTSTLSTSVMTIGFVWHISVVKFLCEPKVLKDAFQSDEERLLLQVPQVLDDALEQHRNFVGYRFDQLLGAPAQVFSEDAVQSFDGLYSELVESGLSLRIRCCPAAGS